MDLVTKRSENKVDIIITGNIKSIVDGQTIKDAILKSFNHNDSVHINLHIKDSFIITSSVIGFLIKVIKLDKIPLHVIVESDELYVMLNEMNLIDDMNVKKA